MARVLFGYGPQNHAIPQFTSTTMYTIDQAFSDELPAVVARDGSDCAANYCPGHGSWGTEERTDCPSSSGTSLGPRPGTTPATSHAGGVFRVGGDVFSRWSTAQPRPTFWNPLQTKPLNE